MALTQIQAEMREHPGSWCARLALRDVELWGEEPYGLRRDARIVEKNRTACAVTLDVQPSGSDANSTRCASTPVLGGAFSFTLS